jgi:hypothetical protein
MTIPLIDPEEPRRMNADDLRTLQAPLKDKYKIDPEAAVFTLKNAVGAENK